MKTMKEHWSKDDALALKQLGKKKWARLDENNTIVEFTTIDPVGRFHPSLRWIEVDHDTQWGTTVTLFGSEVGYIPTIGMQPDEYKDFLIYQKEFEEAMNKIETKDREPEISQYTINIVSE